MPAQKQDLASEATPTTDKSSKTSPYHAGFQQHLINAGIYPNGYRRPDGTLLPKPNNIDEIRQRLAQPRPSLHCSEDDFLAFEEANNDAQCEQDVATSVLPKIYNASKERNSDGRSRAQNLLFANLIRLTNDTTAAAKPDVCYGTCPEQLDAQIQTDLHSFIAPNFFLGAFGPDGTYAVALRQAWHCGVLGARGMHRLRSYRQQQPVPTGKADTITCVYVSQVLHIYTIHPQQERQRLAYVMTHVNSFAMTGDLAKYEEGVTAFQNAKDWTQQQRDEAIQQANKRLLPLTLPEAGGAEDELAPSPRPVWSKRSRNQSERPRKRRR